MAVKSEDPPPYTAVANNKTSSVHKLIVGVDFGTTYTGVSYVSTAGTHEKTLHDVHCVRDWPGPGRDGDYSWKAPSRISFGSEDDSTQNHWGFEVTPHMESYAWFKLLLDPTQATKYDDPSLASSESHGVLTRPINKKPVEICADYLTEVANFAYQSIVKRISAEVLQATPIEFWFTVPAVWSDKAKADTLRAARMAARQAKLKLHAQSQVMLIREPEAAAIATLSFYTQGGTDHQVQIGDSIMVCDCGGGTVDITTYEITEITPQLAFKELLVGTGGKCGSTYIDREFIKWMEKKFGKAYSSLSWAKRGPASRLMKDFESAKRDFGKSNHRSKYHEIQIYMKGADHSKHYDEDDGIVKLYHADLKAMFDPVVSKIIELLESQLDAERRQTGKVTIKTMLLVGGFGDSQHLSNVLGEWSKTFGIKLLVPEHPQSAIVRGAALSGLLNIQPTSRRSRMHYGWKCHEPFDRVRHDKRDRFIWDWDGSARASGNMCWELSKGDLVDEDTTVTFCFNQTFHEKGGNRSSSLNLYCSSKDDPPYHERQGVTKLAKISLDFSDVDLNVFESRMVKGKHLRQVDCKVVVSFGHRRGVLIFKCTAQGKDIGQATITFDGQDQSEIEGGLGVDGAHTPGCAMQ